MSYLPQQCYRSLGEVRWNALRPGTRSVRSYRKKHSHTIPQEKKATKYNNSQIEGDWNRMDAKPEIPWSNPN